MKLVQVLATILIGSGLLQAQPRDHTEVPAFDSLQDEYARKCFTAFNPLYVAYEKQLQLFHDELDKSNAIEAALVKREMVMFAESWAGEKELVFKPQIFDGNGPQLTKAEQTILDKAGLSYYSWNHFASRKPIEEQSQHLLNWRVRVLYALSVTIDVEGGQTLTTNVTDLDRPENSFFQKNRLQAFPYKAPEEPQELYDLRLAFLKQRIAATPAVADWYMNALDKFKKTLELESNLKRKRIAENAISSISQSFSHGLTCEFSASTGRIQFKNDGPITLKICTLLGYNFGNVFGPDCYISDAPTMDDRARSIKTLQPGESLTIPELGSGLGPSTYWVSEGFAQRLGIWSGAIKVKLVE